MRPLIKFLLLGLLVSASACSRGDKDSFRNVDHDKNGKISYEELLFVFPDVTPDAFRQSDTNNDGFLSENEYSAFLKNKVQPAALGKSAPTGPSQTKAAAGNDTNQPAVPYKGEEVIEIPPPAPETHPIVAKGKPEKGHKDQKNKPDTANRTEASQYTVVRGDNLSKIAQRYGLTVEDITRANGNMPPDTLRDGQVLTIPPHHP
jgi:LysM repeat protein